MGLDALIARHIARPDAQRGLSGYTRVTFWELPRYRSEPYRIEGAGALNNIVRSSSRLPTPGNMAMVHRSRPGLAWTTGGSISWWLTRSPCGASCLDPRLVQGRLQPGRGLHMHAITSALITAERPIAYHADGEPGLGGVTSGHGRALLALGSRSVSERNQRSFWLTTACVYLKFTRRPPRSEAGSIEFPMFTRHLRNADHTRRYSIAETPAGWEVRKEQDSQVIRRGAHRLAPRGARAAFDHTRGERARGRRLAAGVTRAGYSTKR